MLQPMTDEVEGVEEVKVSRGVRGGGGGGEEGSNYQTNPKPSEIR